MRKRNLVSISVFCEKYNLNKNSFESTLAKRYFPKDAVDFTGGHGKTKIDEEYFLNKKNMIEKLWQRACENYYVLNEQMNDYRLSKALHAIDSSKSVSSWSMFLYENLFTPPPEKITKIKITQGVYLFLRYSNWLIKRRSGC